MRRMPSSRRLSALASARRPVEEPLRQIARMVAAQHASAPRGPEIAEQGSREALGIRWVDNIDQARQAGLLDPMVIDETQLLTAQFLAGHAPLLRARIRD